MEPGDKILNEVTESSMKTIKEDAGQENKQEKTFKRVCVLIIICVVGGFVLDNFGIFRFLPREISDCVGVEMEVFQSKYHMDKCGENSIIGANVLITSDNDGKIISVYSDCKGVFKVHGITCGMSEEKVLQKKPQSYVYHSSKDGSDFYLSYDTDRILSFDFDKDNKLKELSYFYYDLSSFRWAGKTQKQGSSVKGALSELPTEVSGFLEKAVEEIKVQYQLELSEVTDVALEKENVSMLDSDDDGKIDTIIIGDKSGQYTLLGMNSDVTFNEKYIPSNYIFQDSNDIYANSIVDSYTSNDYVSDDGHKILEIQYWKDKKIKQISLAYSKEKIVPAALTSTLPKEVSTLLEKEIETVKREYQLEEGEIFSLEQDNAYMGDIDDDGRIDIIGINDEQGNHTLFGMKCNDYFSSTKVPVEYSFYDSTDFPAAMAMDAYTCYQYLSQDKQKVLSIEFWQDEKIKSIVLAKEEQSDSGEYSSFYENQDDDLVYGWDNEDDDYGYEEDDNEYYEDYDYEDEYILPYSDVQKLKKSDLQGLSKTELRLARNEIYARHGRRFQDNSLQEYFDSQDWYYGYIEPENFIDSEELSALERRNAKFIKKFE